MPNGTENDRNGWHLEEIGVNDKETKKRLAGLSRGREEIRVAIVDTGFDYTHQSLKDRMDMRLARDFDHADPKRQPDGLPVGLGQIENKFDAHGTACAGIIVANGDEGIYGVAPGCTIVPVRISSNFDPRSLANSIRYAGREAHVILLPRFVPKSPEVDSAISDVINDNKKPVAVICPAGNNGTSTLMYPALRTDTIAVGACNDECYRATYSQYQINRDHEGQDEKTADALDLVAPSSDVAVEDASLIRLDPEDADRRLRERAVKALRRDSVPKTVLVLEDATVRGLEVLQNLTEQMLEALIGSSFNERQKNLLRELANHQEDRSPIIESYEDLKRASDAENLEKLEKLEPLKELYNRLKMLGETLQSSSNKRHVKFFAELAKQPQGEGTSLISLVSELFRNLSAEEVAKKVDVEIFAPFRYFPDKLEFMKLFPRDISYETLSMLEVLLEGSPDGRQTIFIKGLTEKQQSGTPLINSLSELLELASRKAAPEIIAPLYKIHQKLWNADRLGLLSIATTDNRGEFGYNVDPPRDYCSAGASRDNFQFGGTSAAAAQVAGVVALMLSAVLEKTGSVEEVNTNLRPEEIGQLLRESARENSFGLKHEISASEFGAGLLYAPEAVAAASSYIRPAPVGAKKAAA